MLLKKTVHNKLVAKENNTGTSGFVLKTKHDTDKSDLEKEITDTEKNFLIIVDLLKKTNYNTKITEIEGIILSISGLATNAALTAVENKITGISRLVKKQIMRQKYQTLKINILLQLIPIILLKILLLIT